MERKHVKLVVIVVSAVLTLALLFLQAGLVNIAFASTARDISIQITSNLNADRSKAAVHIDVKPNKQGVQITSIQLPNGKMVSGSNATYQATDNGMLSFIVLYQIPFDDKNPQLNGNVDAMASKQQVYTYQVKGIHKKYGVNLQANSEFYAQNMPNANNTALKREFPIMNKGSLDSSLLVNEQKTEGAFTYKTDGSIIAYDVDKGGVNVAIPFQFSDGTIIRKINDRAFYRSASATPIKTVTFPENSAITSIGDNAFQFNILNSVKFPASIQNLGAYAFANNYIINLSLMPYTGTGSPSQITLGTGVFSNNQIQDLTVTASMVQRITKIPDEAFANNFIESITIPGFIKSVGNSAFKGNNALNVGIGEGVETIGNNVFENNKLITITLPSTLKKIGSDVCKNNKLTCLPIPNSVTSMGANVMGDQLVNGVTCESDGKGNYAVNIAKFGAGSLGALFDVNKVSNPKGYLPNGIPLSDFTFNKGTGEFKFTYNQAGSLPENCYITYNYRPGNNTLTDASVSTIKLNNLKTWCTVTFDANGGYFIDAKTGAHVNTVDMQVSKGDIIRGQLPKALNPYNGDETDTTKQVFNESFLLYTESSCGPSSDFKMNTPITQDITLYKKWLPTTNKPEVFLEIPSGIKLYDFDDGIARGTGEVSLKTLDAGSIRWYANKIFHITPTAPTVTLTSPKTSYKFNLDLMKPDGTKYLGKPNEEYIQLNYLGQYGCQPSAKFTLQTPFDYDQKNKANVDYSGNLTFQYKITNPPMS